MKREDLLKRIENVDFFTISKMSPEVLLRLTDDFKEQMVLKLVARANTNASQRLILKSVLKAYAENQKKTNPVWGMWGSEKYPEYLENLQLDIECGKLITDEEEADNLEERMDDYMAKHTMTKEDIDKAISDAESNMVPDEKSSETIAALEERIKELEAEIEKQKSENKKLKAENERLSKENDELKEIKMIMGTPLDAIEADSKVGLTEILKLMVNDGANFAKHNNKTIASKALKMMTGRSESACKQIFSSPLSPTYSGHKNKISELNGYLKALGMKTLL
jgi:predicted RNase H-like nuclease (RuvC/YqgF family)